MARRFNDFFFLLQGQAISYFVYRTVYKRYRKMKKKSVDLANTLMFPILITDSVSKLISQYTSRGDFNCK